MALSQKKHFSVLRTFVRQRGLDVVAHPRQGPTLPLFLDQTEPRKAVKKNFETALPPNLRVWVTPPPPPYLKVWVRH